MCARASRPVRFSPQTGHATLATRASAVPDVGLGRLPSLLLDAQFVPLENLNADPPPPPTEPGQLPSRHGDTRYVVEGTCNVVPGVFVIPIRKPKPPKT